MGFPAQITDPSSPPVLTIVVDTAYRRRGDPGEDGQDGFPGRAGVDGVPGTAGTAGLNGVDGAQGPRGLQGDPGEDGTQGPPGLVGASGANGADGAPGSPGSSGADGARGSPGDVGEDGADGIPGFAIRPPDFRASGAPHASGLVPDPGNIAGAAKFLREDATWASPTATVALNADGGVWPYGVLDAGVINNDSFDGGGP